jgi:hypothetical protein
MSWTETIKGKLRLIWEPGMDITKEQAYESVCKQAGFEKIPDHCVTWEDLVEWELDSVMSYEGKLYEIYDRYDLDNESSIILIQMPDGTYQFLTSFYNGGAGLRDMLNEGFKELEKNKVNI